MATFGIVGIGWRAEFFVRIARELPDRFKLAGLVARSAQKGAVFAQRWGVPVFSSLDALVSAGSPDFMVVSVPWASSVEVITECSERWSVPVLAETPPAPDIEGLNALCRLTAAGARIQVAEQYAYQPEHAARIAVAHSGLIGTPSQAQVSAAHGYHGISLIRKLLGVSFENAPVTASSYTTPIVAGPGRDGPPAQRLIVESEQVIAQLAFDDGKFGVYDFAGEQYFSYIRGQRLLVRGESGEIDGTTVRRLLDEKSGVTLRLERVDTGQCGNLEGCYHRGYTLGSEWVYRNPFPGARLADDEIAIATSLEKMAAYCKGGPEVYGLAEAAQDRYLDILIEESLRSQRSIRSETQAWATSGQQPR